MRVQASARLIPDTPLQVSVTAGRHSFVADEPESYGGTDVGPSPGQMMLAALGACQIMTFQIWARKLGLRMDGVEVSVSGDLDPQSWIGEESSNRPGFSQILFKATVTGPEPEERYAELARLVDEHCPIMDSLLDVVPVLTEVEFKSPDQVS
ncbi:OsmC family protein [Nonomuraea sp. SYSU D8015]|uniref:OsmC family protein n=1 Tax=Nonomuraea sp. SYSU D8015 TaxID=2593644 RepID=UPI0016614A84|nr:OsmC family protein [Nonomuraea sp. SYSU D8015]